MMVVGFYTTTAPSQATILINAMTEAARQFQELRLHMESQLNQPD